MKNNNASDRESQIGDVHTESRRWVYISEPGPSTKQHEPNRGVIQSLVARQKYSWVSLGELSDILTTHVPTVTVKFCILLSYNVGSHNIEIRSKIIEICSARNTQAVTGTPAALCCAITLLCRRRYITQHKPADPNSGVAGPRVATS